jgi:soluble lytic murein transglycosylase-like protein
MWLTEGEGPLWVPTLNDTEDHYGIPHNLLARVAYEESHFRTDIILGHTTSPVGAIGIMQLMPHIFPGAGVSPAADINTAGQLLFDLYNRFHDWQVALAAYNWGQGNVHHEYAKDADKYILADMPDQTQNYVKQIVADVPVPGALV